MSKDSQCSRCGRISTPVVLPNDSFRCVGCETRMSGAAAAATWYLGKQAVAREWLLGASAKETADFIEELTFKGYATQAFNITHQLIKGTRLKVIV